MGMFNWVNYKCNCPVCGNTVTEFQTKDGVLDLSLVETSEILQWHALCDCGHLIEKTHNALDLPWEGFMASLARLTDAYETRLSNLEAEVEKLKELNNAK